MMSQMYDFSRAQKMRENVTGFLELPHSGGQQWQTRSVNMGSSQVQVHCKHQATTIPAPGDLTLEDTNSHKGRCRPERHVTPGRFKWGTSHIHSEGRENSKDFLKRRLLKGSLILSYDLETKKAGKALWEEGSTWTKSRDTDWGKGWKFIGVQQALWLSTFPVPLPPKRKPKTIPCVRDDGNIYKHISKGLHRFGWMPTPFPHICRQTKHSKTLTGKSQTPLVGHVPLGVGREINDRLFTTAGLPS